MPAEVTFTVNGKTHKLTTPADRPLLEVLREDLKLTGTKYGCGEGQCRACTVLIGGKAVISCRLPVADVAGKSVTTIEGLAESNGNLHAVQQAFVDAGAMQCGYCVPGMVLTTAALLKANPNPSEREIIGALNGNLCRCCGYPNIVAAVRLAASRSSKPGKEASNARA
jgi:aerobic-type carbon monoxide dehydrogenase small subunit (CoxS/CutS family)